MLKENHGSKVYWIDVDSVDSSGFVNYIAMYDNDNVDSLR